MTKVKLYATHAQLVRTGKFYTARRLYDLLTGESITLGVGDVESGLFDILDKMGAPWHLNPRTGSASFYKWEILKN